MNNFIQPLFIVLALLAAGTMGFAIQRGATCSVAAMDEIIHHRDTRRLAAMLEAAVWVAVGLGLAQHLHLLNALPGGYGVTIWTFIGAVILGLGAYINGACVIGAVARIGSGQWVYLLTPVGFFLGCISMNAIFGMPTQIATPSANAMALAASLALWPLAVLLIWRICNLFRRKNKSKFSFKNPSWSPHVATILIGFSFLLTLVFSGKWAYTEVLAELAHGMSQNLTVRILLAVALFIGAVVGGKVSGQFCWTNPSIKLVVRCLAGSMMMAWGSMLIPGSNDGLILVGMPLLWPYAWIAFLTMCLSIGIAQLASRQWMARKIN